jgi:hypothetical protein
MSVNYERKHQWKYNHGREERKYKIPILIYKGREIIRDID